MIRPSVSSSITSSWSPRTLLRKCTATELTPAKTSSNSNLRSGAAASPLAKYERSAGLPRTVPAGSPSSLVTRSVSEKCPGAERETGASHVRLTEDFSRHRPRSLV